MYLCGTSSSTLVINQIYLYSNDKTKCFKALKADPVTNIFTADSSGSFIRVVCPTSCDSSNTMTYSGTDFKVTKGTNELPYTIDFTSLLSNPGSLHLTQSVLPDVVFEDGFLDWEGRFDYAVSKGGRLLEIQEWKNIFARRALHNKYDNNNWTYRAQAFYLTN